MPKTLPNPARERPTHLTSSLYNHMHTNTQLQITCWCLIHLNKKPTTTQYIETEKKELLEQAENVNISFMNLNDMLLLTNINSAREKSIWK